MQFMNLISRSTHFEITANCAKKEFRSIREGRGPSGREYARHPRNLIAAK